MPAETCALFVLSNNVLRCFCLFSFTDLEAYALTVTSPTDLIFDIGVDNIVTYSIDLRNAGGTDIASSASGNNFALSFLISSHADPSDVDASTLMFDAETSNSDNLDAGITAGSTITVSTASAMINIPSDDCETYQYTCVEVSKVDTAVFTDSVSTNNYVCLGFGDVAEGLAGIKTCSGVYFNNQYVHVVQSKLICPHRHPFTPGWREAIIVKCLAQGT